MEYAILIVIVLGALLSIQVYIKRGVQGRLKSAADDIGEQFSPGNTNIVTKVQSYSNTQETFAGGVTRSQLMDEEQQNVETDSVIVNADQEYWGTKPTP